MRPRLARAVSLTLKQHADTQATRKAQVYSTVLNAGGMPHTATMSNQPAIMAPVAEIQPQTISCDSRGCRGERAQLRLRGTLTADDFETASIHTQLAYRTDGHNRVKLPQERPRLHSEKKTLRLLKHSHRRRVKSLKLEPSSSHHRPLPSRRGDRRLDEEQRPHSLPQRVDARAAQV